MIADLVLIISGLIMLVKPAETNGLEVIPPAEMATMFIVIITVVPWHMGYLLQQFQSYSRIIQTITKWVFGIITLALVVFLIINFLPLMEDKDNMSPLENFIFSFGIFFLVLGPMMIMGGYTDGQSIDESKDPSKPYINPILTAVMGIVALSIVYLILIVGFFDPYWEGNVSFLVILLAFILGPLASILTFIPFFIIGKWLEKNDTKRLVPNIINVLLPLITFQTMIWWNDIVLFNLKGFWEGGSPSVAQILWSMTLAGIVPFRLIMLIKPPFKIYGLLFGILALGLYIYGVLHEYGAI